MRNFLNFERSSYSNPNWSAIFGTAHAAWSDEALAAHQVETRPWTDADSVRYFRWFWRWGGSELPTPREDAEARIRRRDEVPISQRQYAPIGSKMRNMGNNALKNAIHALGLIVKKGCRRVGKAILTNCRSQLEDASMPLRIEDLLEQRGLPTKIEDIPDSSDESETPHANVPSNLQAEDIVNPDGRLNTGRLDDILGPPSSSHPYVGPTQVTLSGPTPTQPAPFYSGSSSTSQFAGMYHDPTGIFSSHMPAYRPAPPFTTFGQTSAPFSPFGQTSAPFSTFGQTAPPFTMPVYQPSSFGTPYTIPSFSSPLGSIGGGDSFTSLLQTAIQEGSQYEGPQDVGQEEGGHDGDEDDGDGTDGDEIEEDDSGTPCLAQRKAKRVIKKRERFSPSGRKR